MNKQIGLWIDHKKAIMLTISDGGENIEQIESGMGGRKHYRGATHPRTPYSAQYQKGDDQLDKQFTEGLKKFYNKVISSLRGADSVLILGPGEAKTELEKRLIDEKIPVQIAAVETADKMTIPQIAAKIRAFFNNLS